MDDLTKARILSPVEIDELRADVKVASAALDEARRKLISSKIKDTVAKDKQPPSSS